MVSKCLLSGYGLIRDQPLISLEAHQTHELSAIEDLSLSL